MRSGKRLPERGLPGAQGSKVKVIQSLSRLQTFDFSRVGQ